MTISEWATAGERLLRGAGVASARLDTLLLLENILGKSREWILAHNESKLTQTNLETLNKNLTLRKNHTPLAYIIGSKEFYGRSFLVSKNVLIPRPESETIIDLLCKVQPCNKVGPCKILDVGTGSGCLAITAQLELPEAVVFGTDVSDGALKVARRNAEALKAPVQFYKANLLDLPSGVKADVILANLPYVPDGLVSSEEIKKEPKAALFAGKDGLDCYRTFWGQMISIEHRPGMVIVESLSEQHGEMAALAKKAGYTLNLTDTLIQLFTRD